MFHRLSTKTAHRCIKAAIVTLLGSCLFSLTTHASTPTATATPTPTPIATATLPPEPPKGVSVLNSNGRALRTGILTNCNVDMISLLPDWDSLEHIEGAYVWDSIDNDLNYIYPYGKTVLLRINTMGGCAPTGNTPSWVFSLMHADCSTVTPGVTYSFLITRIRSGELFQFFGILLTWQKRKRSLQWRERT